MKPIKLKITPTIQYENHTCGYCAACSVYEYYDLDPEELGLREYLGVDNVLPYKFPARQHIERWMGGPGSAGTGTMPMDMLAVLHWDGFDTETLTGSYGNFRSRLRSSLRAGNPALVVLYSFLHWAVVSGMDDEGVWIVDGIFTNGDMNGGRGRSNTYRLSHDCFAAEQHGVILLSRDDAPDGRTIRDMTYPAFIREYTRGTVFAAAMIGQFVPRRIKALLSRA